VKSRCGVALLVAAALVAGSVQSASALPKSGGVAAGTSGATGLAVTGGFIIFVAVLVGYDFWLKTQGLKNWDGTPLATGKKKK
jgi:hypothetical protein